MAGVRVRHCLVQIGFLALNWAGMILPKLLSRFAKHRDDAVFYEMQAEDAIRWLASKGVPLTAETTVLDLGCGHGVFGGALLKRGCKVTFADEKNYLLPQFQNERFLGVNLDRDSISALGRFDLVICSNVLEHLAKPERLLGEVADILNPGGRFYLSWTNWLSPWGGHEFSPLHYLGAGVGPRIYDKLAKRPRFHKPFENLFPTYIGTIMTVVRRNRRLTIDSVAPRYYTEFAWLMKVPVIREFLAWNCAMLISAPNIAGVASRAGVKP